MALTGLWNPRRRASFTPKHILLLRQRPNLHYSTQIAVASELCLKVSRSISTAIQLPLEIISTARVSNTTAFCGKLLCNTTVTLFLTFAAQYHACYKQLTPSPAICEALRSLAVYLWCVTVYTRLFQPQRKPTVNVVSSR